MGEATRELGEDPLAGEGPPDDEDAPQSEREAEERILDDEASDE